MARKKKQRKERFTFTEEQRTADPQCEYFGRCGGCKYQDVDYALQVQAKSDWLSGLFERTVKVVPSPNAYGYRNRMDFVYAFGKLGLRERGTYKWVVDIERCPLMSDAANRLLGEVRAQLFERNIPCYNYIKHEGYLRYAVIRSTRAGETLVSMVTADDSPQIEPVLEALKGKANSINRLIHSGMADLSYGPVERWLESPTIREEISGRTFYLGPNTFFQNNPWLIERVIEDIRGFVSGRTLDLYCGVGSIGICVADRAERVLGVESVEDSVRLAEENARVNQVDNIDFMLSEVKPWVRERSKQEDGERWTTAIVDPPREGLTPKVVKYLTRLQPTRIAYVSCNPKALAEELRLMEGYRPVFLRGYDLFPQTPHVEVLAVMEKVEEAI